MDLLASSATTFLGVERSESLKENEAEKNGNIDERDVRMVDCHGGFRLICTLQ